MVSQCTAEWVGNCALVQVLYFTGAAQALLY